VLNRIYLVVGITVIALYALTEINGWELFGHGSPGGSSGSSSGGRQTSGFWGGFYSGGSGFGGGK
jgi:hypothetical protein